VTVAKFRTSGESMQTSVKGMTVFNTDVVDTTKQKMFFGPPLGVQRYDKFKYPVFDKLTQQQLGYFWRPEEVSLQKDRADYPLLNDAQKHIFTSNLKYQILLDSVQGRGPGMAFTPYCSLPELEGAMNIWQTMEMVHSRSYTHIIKNVYADPSEVFDHILEDEKILSRAQTVTHAYDEFLQAASEWGAGRQWQHYLEEVPNAQWELRELKRKLYRAVANVYILEGIRFYVSFACSFAFGELKLLEGSAKIIGLIARDESLHMTITQNILNKWRDGDDPEMAEIVKEEEENVYEMFKQCVEEEKAWAQYLFKDGSIIGLNDKLLASYVEWTANRRLKSIGLKAIFDTPISNNPLPWTAHWLSSKGMQVAPQETEVESYLIGSIKQDVKKDTFANFKL
jgi:ribonucleotide reductase beta subunit family protein with ferritin-like domain